jgi:nucleoside-diphosphate-sugar epimerase
MAKRITIIGAGYVGMVLAKQAIEQGLEVAGTSRTAQTRAELEAMGAVAIAWDALDDPVERLDEVIDEETAVVYSVPTVYRDYEDSSEGMARHVEPVERVLSTCARRGAQRFVYLSSTSVYGDQQGEWVDEQTTRAPTSPYGRMRRDIEDHVLGYGREMPVNVARLVGIYGPGRTILQYVESGRYKLVDGGTKPTNRIHVDDIVRAVFAIIEHAGNGARVYNLCDGDPRTVAEVIDFLVERLGIERPEEISLEKYAETRGPNGAARWKNTYRCKSDRLVGELGVELRFQNVLEGYRELFDLDDSEPDDNQPDVND